MSSTISLISSIKGIVWECVCLYTSHIHYPFFWERTENTPGAATPSLLGQARLILVDLGYLQIGSNWMIKCDGFGVVLMYMLVRAISNDSTVQARKV